VAVSTEHPAKIEDHDTKLKVKFLRSEVKPTLTPGDSVRVTVTGSIAGEGFIGVDYIKVKAPKMHKPKVGDLLAAGTTTEVTWEIPEGPPVQSVTLLSSFDDGVSWTVQAEDLPNTGSYYWTVPSTTTDQARLQIMVVYDTDETGVIPESEFAVGDVFSIVAPTGVAGGSVTFALQTANPVVGTTLSVHFSLPLAAPATLDLFDVTGRCVVSRDVGSLGTGQHTLNLAEGKRLSAGLYFLRLIQGVNVRSLRVVVTN
jgi:hypothetical protein